MSAQLAQIDSAGISEKLKATKTLKHLMSGFISDV